MVKRQCYLCDIEANSLLCEPPLIIHKVKELATSHEVHREVNSVFSLKDELHLHDEGMVDLTHNQLLQLDGLHTVVVHNHVFPHGLECVELTVRRQVNQIHLCEGPFAKDRNGLELFEEHAFTLSAPLIHCLSTLFFLCGVSMLLIALGHACLGGDTAIIKDLAEESRVVHLLCGNLLVLAV